MHKKRLVFLILLLIKIVTIILLIIYLSKRKKKPAKEIVKETIHNPPMNFWLHRHDGTGSVKFHHKNLYVNQVITSPTVTSFCNMVSKPPKKCPFWEYDSFCRNNKCVIYVNAEVYDNPCCLSFNEVLNTLCKNLPQAKGWQTKYTGCSSSPGCEKDWMPIGSKSCPSLLERNLECGKLGDLADVLQTILGAKYKSVMTLFGSKIYDELVKIPVAKLENELSKQSCLLYANVCQGQNQRQTGTCHLEKNPIGMDNPFTALVQSVKDSYFNTPYLYATLEIKVRAVGLDGGSRGWGFWNTQLPADINTFAWFIQQQGENPDYPPPPPKAGQKPVWQAGKPYALNGLWILMRDPEMGPKGLVRIRLADLDENSHTYKIVWTPQSIVFMIDNKVVYSADKKKVKIPSRHMAFHAWVDNAVFGSQKLGGKTIPAHWTHEFKGIRANEIEYIKITPFK
uniref:Glycosyl hydrolase family 16 n=1 Tax=Iridovirus LCIVAC01 TaxID=2506607 RepID=A0A481YQ59_9VIRU|nr:MAG: glycosyl hydrolase family 16 [Iridovirus LCIVAC01]